MTGPIYIEIDRNGRLLAYRLEAGRKRRIPLRDALPVCPECEGAGEVEVSLPARESDGSPPYAMEPCPECAPQLEPDPDAAHEDWRDSR